MIRNRTVRVARLCGCAILLGALSAAGAADIAWKYDTSGRDGSIVEPATGTEQAFASFDSTSRETSVGDLSLATVLVQYFSVFDSNVAEILTTPPGTYLILK